MGWVAGLWSELTPDGFCINAEPMSVSVTGPVHGLGKRSVADASVFLSHPGAWYLNRVLVAEKHRGQGYGSKLVDHLKKAIVKHGGVLLVVEPGGYGSDPVRLQRFYKRSGFQEDSEFEGALVWRATPSP